MQDCFELLRYLKSLNLLDSSPSWWWDNCGKFEVVLGVILTQNTKWSNVEASLENLRQYKIINDNDDENLERIAHIDTLILSNLIRKSGFANQKSVRLKLLAKNILDTFGGFETFVAEVSGEWLLAQKGIGMESRDSILNYACKREVMVVDKYTHKLLCGYGIEIFEYEDLQNWFVSGINDNLQNVMELYDNKCSLAQIYARFHGKIVEFCK